MEWFKFYHQKWLTDRKIISLSAVDRVCFIASLSVTAARDDRSGLIENYVENDIIRLAQLRDAEAKKAVGFTQRFLTLGLFEVENETDIRVKNFEKAQSSALTDAERARRYRKKQKEMELSNTVTKTVTDERDERHGRVEKSRVEKNKSILSKIEPVDLELATLLHDLIVQNNPDWQMRGSLETWATHIEKLRRIDRRTPEQIRYMIRWTQQDSFWQQNILSTEKLRKQFNTLIPKAKAAAIKSQQPQHAKVVL